MGVQIPPADREDFAQALDGLSYPHWDETDNPAYRIFAGNG